jgi:pimeloyl-ACP methyl ester carboxylesterase
MKYRGFRRAILSTLRNFLSRDPLPYHESLKVNNKRILLIWGKEDKITPFSDGEKLKMLLSPEYLAIDEAGHLPHYETPEIVNNAIIEFLNSDLIL